MKMAPPTTPTTAQRAAPTGTTAVGVGGWSQVVETRISAP
jgi:hypothetical protein